MAELAISAIASAFTTAGAGAAAVGTAATAAGAAGMGASMLSTLSTVATIGSAVAAFMGGEADYAESANQARVADLNVQAAELKAEQDALTIKRELVQRVAATRVAFAGSGFDIASGQDIEDSLGQQAKYEIGFARSGGKINAASAMSEASSIRARGSSRRQQAMFKAGGTLLDGAIDYAKRGV